MAEDVRSTTVRRRPGAIVIDCMLQAALAAGEQSGLPAAILVRTFSADFLGTPEPRRTEQLGQLNDLRAQLGLTAVASLEEAWCNSGRVLVLASPALDPGADHPPPGSRFVGPVFDPGSAEPQRPALHGESAAPVVLLSLTTLYHRDKVSLFQRVLDALADLPVRVVVTAGDVSPA